MICKLADLYIELNTVYPSALDGCEDYLCENPPHIDFSITTTEEDIEYEISNAESEGEEDVKDFPRDYLEHLAVYRKICAAVLERDGFLMHGALIEYEGKGYLFTAKSGTGKTTHIRLWRKLFGKDNVMIVNGDKPILRFLDGKFYAYGTPWCGKERYNVNTRVPLCGICFIERDETNSIKKLPVHMALQHLFSQIMITDSADLGKQLELIDALLERVPTYMLKCNMDIEAAKVAYEGMNKTKKEG